VAVAVSVDDWWEYFDAAFARIAGRFGRVEPRRAARDWLLAVLSDADTRSCWQLAEGPSQVGEVLQELRSAILSLQQLYLACDSKPRNCRWLLS
jgi:hypothetical protein